MVPGKLNEYQRERVIGAVERAGGAISTISARGGMGGWCCLRT